MEMTRYQVDGVRIDAEGCFVTLDEVQKAILENSREWRTKLAEANATIRRLQREAANNAGLITCLRDENHMRRKLEDGLREQLLRERAEAAMSANLNDGYSGALRKDLTIARSLNSRAKALILRFQSRYDSGCVCIHCKNLWKEAEALSRLIP
jgi:hypothetical protein